MKLVRCDGCGELLCRHQYVHEPDSYCQISCCDGTKNGIRCRPVRTHRMWQVYRPDGTPAGGPVEPRAEALEMVSANWKRMYRHGWRCQPVTVIEEE